MTIDINKAAQLGRKSGILSVVLGSIVFLLIMAGFTQKSSMNLFQSLSQNWLGSDIQDWIVGIAGLMAMLLFEFFWGAWVGRRVLQAGGSALGWSFLSAYLDLIVGVSVTIGVEKVLKSGLAIEPQSLIQEIGVYFAYSCIFAFPAILIFSLLRWVWYRNQRERASRVLW